MRGAVSGDRHATQTLVASVAPAMLRATRGVLGADHPDVEDVLQDGLVGLMDALATFHGHCSVLHFACRVAVLTSLAARRKLQLRGQHHAEAPEEASVEGVDPVAAARRRQALRELCDELSPQQTEALVMHCVLGFSVEEVADATEAPFNTVRSRLRLAKEALRARIAADPDLRDTLEVSP
jgi:RNA polymerase sigma-70 factor (ECF subfamily)